MESQSEGDSSPIPQALRDWLKEGAKILQDMAAEEVAEMMSELKAWRSNRRVRSGACRQDRATLPRPGRSSLPPLAKKLAKAHQAIREAGDHLASTGYDKDCDDEDGSKATLPPIWRRWPANAIWRRPKPSRLPQSATRCRSE